MQALAASRVPATHSRSRDAISTSRNPCGRAPGALQSLRSHAAFGAAGGELGRNIGTLRLDRSLLLVPVMAFDRRAGGPPGCPRRAHIEDRGHAGSVRLSPEVCVDGADAGSRAARPRTAPISVARSPRSSCCTGPGGHLTSSMAGVYRIVTARLRSSVRAHRRRDAIDLQLTSDSGVTGSSRFAAARSESLFQPASSSTKTVGSSSRISRSASAIAARARAK